MFKQIFLDILFPISCLGCKKDNIWLCDNCLNKIKITKNRCQWAPILSGLIIATDYENELVKQLISKITV